MRRILVSVIFLTLATAANAAVVATDLGTTAPPATLGPFTMTSMAISGPDGTTLSSLTDGTYTLGFSPSLTTSTVPTGWITWSHGATPRVLYFVWATSSPGPFTVTATPPVVGIQLYLEPANTGPFSLTVDAYSGASLLASQTISVNGNAGANGYGFHTTAGEQLDRLVITLPDAAGGFAIGEIARANGTAVTVDTAPTGLGITVDATPYTAPQGFSWPSGGTHTVATTTPQSPGPGTRYVFQSWSDAGAISHSVGVPVAATTLTATFATQYYLTTSVAPAGGGTITPASGYFDAGTPVLITAVPSPDGAQFRSFSGALTGATNPQTLNIDGPRSVLAEFYVLIPALGRTGILALAALLALVGALAVRRIT